MNLEEILSYQYVVATGHRPHYFNKKVDDIAGCDPKHPTVLRLTHQIEQALEKKILEGHTHFMSGAALGFDQLYFWVVHYLKKKYPQLPIQNVVAVPYRNFAQPFWKNQRLWYERMLAVADAVIYVTDLNEYDTNENLPIDDHSIPKLKARNQFMVDVASDLVAYCTDDKSGTGQAIRMAERAGVTITRIEL